MNRIILIIFCFVSVSSSAQLRSAGTGSGSIVYSTSPTLVTPNLGTPSTLVATNATGTASGLTAGNVTTNANLTGDVTSSGNATTIGALKVTTGMLAANAATLAKLDASNATARKILLSQSSASPIWSTETIAVPSTAGNFLMSDGTNWTANNTRTNWTSFVVSGSNATTTGQSLVDITGLTSGTLTNSTLYEVEAFLNVTTSAVTTGVQYAIGAGGSGGAAVVMAILTGNTTGTTLTNENIVATTAISARLLTSGQSGIMYIHGFVTTRGSGTANISIQHLKVTSGTSTVLIGSWFRYRLAN